MKFDPTKPCMTRDGREARIICTDKKGPYPIVAVITGFTGDEYVNTYHVSGRQISDAKGGSDLINIPEKVVQYANVYLERDDTISAYCIYLEDISDSINRCRQVENSPMQVKAIAKITYEIGNFNPE